MKAPSRTLTGHLPLQHFSSNKIVYYQPTLLEDFMQPSLVDVVSFLKKKLSLASAKYNRSLAIEAMKYVHPDGVKKAHVCTHMPPIRTLLRPVIHDKIWKSYPQHRTWSSPAWSPGRIAVKPL